ncbi:hypothetical protein FrEUN1fDRAFT_0955 [Parafrankia sp. EUN1f]|nr:hypothetical protein FrEUN1fDRAFT_0955 [Parafrankia sp. EUN1f]
MRRGVFRTSSATFAWYLRAPRSAHVRAPRSAHVGGAWSTRNVHLSVVVPDPAAK